MPYTLPDGNGTLLELLTWQSTQIPILWPGILFLIFMVIWGSGFLLQDRKTDRGNASMWFAIAGFITSSLAFILFLIPGMINIQTLSITVAISIIGAMWFIFSSDK